uniref:BTB domain-containing protein n=1 Tax=Globodera rostochiensis TaxID=31243 RepID=A0A914I0T6_GLORO
MKRLLGTGDGADVHFLVGQGDEKEATHKLILGTASDVFETRFRVDAETAAGTAKKVEPVVITDVKVGAFKTMLAFIYADDLRGLNGNNALDVLCAANKYAVAGLIKACVDFPKAKLSNVFVAYAQARCIGEKDFARGCLNYIEANAANLLLSKAFLQISQHLLCVVLDRDRLFVCGEIAIWNAVNNF